MSDDWSHPALRESDDQIAAALFGTTVARERAANKAHVTHGWRSWSTPTVAPERARRLPRFMSAVIRLAVTVALTIGLTWVLHTYVVQSFLIPSPSMATTLGVGDRVFVSQLTPGPFELKRGDIVVFTDPGKWLEGENAPTPPPIELSGLAQTLVDIGFVAPPRDDYLIKRIIGMPGDRVTADATGGVQVNGRWIDEPYIIGAARQSDIEFDIVVPDGTVWVMGDNRPNSADSRYNQGGAHGGAVPLEDIFGVAFLNVTAYGEFHWLSNPSDTFGAVPDPA